MSAIWRVQGELLANAQSLEYACFGPSPVEAPTWVLLHEGLGCVALWRDFPQALSDATGWGVFVYSRAGYGQSDAVTLPRPLDYMTQEAISSLPQVLDAISFRSGALFGHSDGATIAAIHAGMVRDARVQGVVLMAPHFFTEPMGIKAIAQAKVEYETGDLKSRLAKYHADPDNAFYGWNGAWLDPDFEAWNVSDALDSITVPVLTIQGKQDQYGSLAQIDIIAQRCPSQVESKILDNCRHSPFLERKEETLASVTKFASQLKLAASG